MSTPIEEEIKHAIYEAIVSCDWTPLQVFQCVTEIVADAQASLDETNAAMAD
jgi:hypothetical protein